MISTRGRRVQAAEGASWPRAHSAPARPAHPAGPAPQPHPADCRRPVPLRGTGLPHAAVGRRLSFYHPDHVRLRPLLALRDLELDPLTLLKGAVAVHLDRAVVDENIRTTVDRDEAVPLLRVEPLDGALSHA